MRLLQQRLKSCCCYSKAKDAARVRAPIVVRSLGSDVTISMDLARFAVRLDVLGDKGSKQKSNNS